MENETMIWPIEDLCDMGCEYYVAGSLDKPGLGIGEHCRFQDGDDPEPSMCEATHRNKEAL